MTRPGNTEAGTCGDRRVTGHRSGGYREHRLQGQLPLSTLKEPDFMRDSFVMSSHSKMLETNSKSILDSEKTKQNPFATCICPEAASFSYRKWLYLVLSAPRAVPATWPLLRQPHGPLMFSCDSRF